ncbi:NAD(P)H-binding protein [Lichenicoccus sp.]|uniref:NAD(P)H-binding protein n=1 Tax=Lichenicoccus sp. TaxID=2781899 RepID=UPI003D0B9457
MIVVTTPTSNISHHVVQHLLDGNEALRCIVRDAGKLPQTVRDRADIVEGSHGDAAVVDRAFDGAEAVFWVAPPTPSETLDHTYINFTRPAAEAIRRLGIPRVVVVAALGRGTEWEDARHGRGRGSPASG